jgi:L-ribulose-5-phosphate 4-epimerase
MLESLRTKVLEANLYLATEGLALFTFGNASGIAREEGLVVIKPSGVPYESMTPEDLVVVDLEGRTVEGTLRPSSDLATHLILYRAFPAIGAVAHTYSHSATAWAQARKEIPCFGTTHADYFNGPVPVTKPLTAAEIRTDYEANTGHAIVRRFAKLDPLDIPAVLVAGHAPFCWGRTPSEAVRIAVVLEEIASMALDTLRANPHAKPLERPLHAKHFYRKHGASAYYGQKK